ncbi:hypothetical protein Avbf_09760 [Armadillidium vulgare]|nr:hypothetical protein Avbf_09760 [Armadillidium vulgare]
MNFMQTRSTSYESDLHNLQNKNSTSFLPHNAVFLGHDIYDLPNRFTLTITSSILMCFIFIFLLKNSKSDLEYSYFLDYFFYTNVLIQFKLLYVNEIGFELKPFQEFIRVPRLEW